MPSSCCLSVRLSTVRTLESLYWSGVKLLVDGRASHHDQDGAGVELRLGQWDAYRLEQAGADKVPVAEALVSQCT